MDVPSLAELNLGIALPAISLAVGASILLLVDSFLPKDRRHLTAWLSMAGVAIAFVLTVLLFNNTGEAMEGMFMGDAFANVLNLVILTATGVTILLGIDYMKRIGADRGEFYVLLLLSASGAMFMGSANDLVVVFVALELLSIPLYIMSAFRLDNAKSEESGMKYFVLGAFASAFFVYGAALVYGATGTTNLPEIFGSVERIVQEGSSSVLYLLVGAALILVGLGFKVAVVPFHMWTPDVYEGAPTPVTAFMSVVAKLGGFAALLRIMIVGLPLLTVGDATAAATWQTATWLIAAVTLIGGNFIAIAQNNIKRMLAYSSIAHAGYVLMAVAAAGTNGVETGAAQSALIYLATYTFTNLGAFGVVMALERLDGTGTEIDDYKGLARRNLPLALIMGVFMLSLTGIPPLAGFWGKWAVFQSTIDAGLIPLAVIGVLTSVVAAYYYLRVVVNMFLSDDEGAEAEYLTPKLNIAIYIAVAGTIFIGIFPMLVTGLTDTVSFAATVLP